MAGNGRPAAPAKSAPKSKAAEIADKVSSARTSLCGPLEGEGGLSGAEEIAAPATDTNKDGAVEKLPDSAAQKPAGRTREKARAFVKSSRKRNCDEREEMDEEQGEEADEEEMSQPKEKRESKQKTQRAFRKAGEENEFMQMFPATMGSGGLRLGTAASVSAVVIYGPFQKEDKLDSQAHVRIVKSAVLNSLSEEQQRKFAEAETTLPEAALTAFALQRVETMRVCGLNIIPKLKLFLNKHFFGETPGSRFKGTFDNKASYDTMPIHPRYIYNSFITSLIHRQYLHNTLLCSAQLNFHHLGAT